MGRNEKKKSINTEKERETPNLIAGLMKRHLLPVYIGLNLREAGGESVIEEIPRWQITQ